MTEGDGDAPDEHVGAPGGGIGTTLFDGVTDERDILARPILDHSTRSNRQWTLYFKVH